MWTVLRRRLPLYTTAAGRQIQRQVGCVPGGKRQWIYVALLDRLDLGMLDVPSAMYHCRVDRHSRRVFIPRGENGVTVTHLNGDKLATESTLTCVRSAVSVDAMSPDTVYVGSDCVYVVDIRNDKITSTLKIPNNFKGMGNPFRLAVLADVVMVGDTHGTAVLYHHCPCQADSFP